MNNYDDEIRIFLVSCLRKISYLKNCREDILTHLAISMVASNADRGSYLHKAKDTTKEATQKMTIIYEGKCAITTKFDSGPETVIEYVSKGTIINAHNFLSDRVSETSTKCLTSVVYYYLETQQLEEIS